MGASQTVEKEECADDECRSPEAPSDLRHPIPNSQQEPQVKLTVGIELMGLMDMGACMLHVKNHSGTENVSIHLRHENLWRRIIQNCLFLKRTKE